MKATAMFAPIDLPDPRLGIDETAPEEPGQEENVESIRRQFEEAAPVSGTPAERYLEEHRGLRGPWPAGLRWKRDYRLKREMSPRPCLLAAVTNSAGDIVALHSIELDARTHSKSTRTDGPKLSKGPISAGTVFLGDRSQPAATLVIGEGIETVLTRCLVGPCDAHACLGAVRFIEPNRNHKRVEVLADTDKRDAARRLARAYADRGLDAYVVTVPDSIGPKADMNDALRDLGLGAVQMAVEDAERFTDETKPSKLSYFDLEIGSDIEIARRILDQIEMLYGPVIVSEGQIWWFDRTHWAPLDENSLVRLVHRADGAEYGDGNGKVKVVRLSKSRVDSIVDAAMHYRQRACYFDKPPIGINCAAGFIAIDKDGVAVLRPHARQWRQRHVVRGRWPIVVDRAAFEASALAGYLRDSFSGDSDAADKIALLGEIAGCAALGYGTRVRNPKAVVPFSEEGATGKSTFLRLLRSLPNKGAVASVPPGKFGDEKYAYQLIGKVLNAADELPDRAVRSDVFKRMVTGEPVPARDLYKSATDFMPVALHVFSTNVLPSFSGGVDGGTIRRLLPIEFTHVVPEAERDPDLPDRILSDESDLFLHFAVEGACRLVRNRDFTVPASSRDLLNRWVTAADPVRAWAAARLVVTAEESVMAVSTLYADFCAWAEHQGHASDYVPNRISFGKRLPTAAPGLRSHRSDGSWYRNARLQGS